jgi:hypothetical protein
MIKNAKVNTAFGGFSWMPDGKSLLVNLVSPKRGARRISKRHADRAEHSRDDRQNRRDSHLSGLLRSPNDEALFDYYATSQLAVVSVDGKIKEIGQPRF